MGIFLFWFPFCRPALCNNDATLRAMTSAVYIDFSSKSGLGQTFTCTHFESLGCGLMIQAICSPVCRPACSAIAYLHFCHRPHIFFEPSVINIILWIAVLYQSRQLGELAFAFDKGRDLEVNSSPPVCHAPGAWTVEGSWLPSSIFKIGCQNGE